MRIQTLRERIESGEYDVPAEDVAEAMLPWIIPTGRAVLEPEPSEPLPPASSEAS
jgi:hypothetical protein